MKRAIYILGNSVVRKDRSPVNLIPYLQKESPEFSFIHIDPTEGIPIPKNKILILIDTIIGIKKVTLYEKFSDFLPSPRVSAHDFDLTTEIPLLIKLGKIKKVIIIGVPQNLNLQKAIKEIKKTLLSI